MPKQESETEKSLKDQCRIFHKLAGFYKWTWQEFRDTPWPVIKNLCEILDEAAQDMDTFLSYDEYSEFKNLKRLHGTSESSTP